MAHSETGLSRWLRGKNLPAMQEMWVQSLGQEDPWRQEWQPTPVFLLGKSHGQRSLVGHSPQDHKELDVMEVTEHTCRRTSVYMYRERHYGG